MREVVGFRRYGFLGLSSPWQNGLYCGRGTWARIVPALFPLRQPGTGAGATMGVGWSGRYRGKAGEGSGNS